MSFADHFSETAGAYAASRPMYPPALAAWLATLPAATHVAWDAGCGSGQLSILLAGHFEHVIGTDASERQIRHARPGPAVEYRCARAENGGLDPASIDLAVAAQAAHWFDLPAWYAEVRRVTRPGGAVALVSYGNPTVDPVVDPILRRFHDETLAACWPHERRHVIGGYAELPFPFSEVAAPALEMTAAWTADRFAAYVDTWSGVRQLLEDGGGAELDTFRRQVRQAWERGEAVRTVRWPLNVRAGRV